MFEAFPKHHSMTESGNINSLADHYIRSTIKTLPATLPETSFKDEVSSAGVTGPVSPSGLRLTKAFAAVRASKSINQRLEDYWLDYNDEKSAGNGKKVYIGQSRG